MFLRSKVKKMKINQKNNICEIITQMELSNENNETNTIVNKGTGAGGSNTNKNGLPYEEMTELKTEYTVMSVDKHHSVISFVKKSEQRFKMTKQGGFFKSMKAVVDKTIIKAHGCKNPDECYIDEMAKRIFIIEKKFQQTTGSVCEKVQTSGFKVWQYDRSFPDYKIVYVYCLSDWFKDNCKAELEYLTYTNTPVFWGNDTNYKNKIIDFIINYK